MDKKPSDILSEYFTELQLRIDMTKWGKNGTDPLLLQVLVDARDELTEFSAFPGPAHKPKEHRPIGCRLAQRLTTALCGYGVPYDKVQEIVYKEIQDISDEQSEGDWIEAPNGDNWTRGKKVMTEADLVRRGITNLFNPNDI